MDTGTKSEGYALSGLAESDLIGRGLLEVYNGLHIRGWVAAGDTSRQELSLKVEDTGDKLVCLTYPRPDLATEWGLENDPVGIYSYLPGWVWLDGDTVRDAVNLQLYCGKLAYGEPLVLTRKSISERVVELIQKYGSATNTFDALLLLENIRYGGLWEDLPKPEKAIFAQIAESYGLSDFLWDHGKGTDAFTPDLLAQSIPASALALGETCNLFGKMARAEGEERSLTDILEEAERLRPSLEQSYPDLVLAVTETFCQRDEFEALYATSKLRLEHPFKKKGETWHDSCVLPFLAMEGRSEEIVSFLWKLSEGEHGWVVQSAMAWAIRYCLFDPASHLDLSQKAEVIYAFIGYVEERGKDYWSRVHGVELIDVIARCLTEKAQYDTTVQAALDLCAIRVYGLSRSFWEALKSKQEVLSGALSVAHNHFTTIQLATLASDQGALSSIDGALAFYERYENPEIQRIRYEVLSVTQANASISASEIERDAISNARDADDEMLRRFAAPGAPDVEEPELQLKIRNVIALGNYNCEVTRFGHRRDQAVQAVIDVMQGISEDASAADPHLERALSKLVPLCIEDANYVGFGIGLKLVATLLHRGHEASAKAVVSFLSEALQARRAPQDAIKSAASRAGLHALRHPEIRGLLPARLARELFQDWDDPEKTAVSNLLDFPDSAGTLGPFFDMVIVIFSCKSNLGSRVEKMRESWLKRLEKIGVPYVVVVGDGKGERDGDVLYLDAPDDYEGLPYKTLAAVEWVYKNTPFGHMYKVDDDCLVDPDALFSSMPYASCDFLGRPVSRKPGDTDRVWHFIKSQSQRGRHELDKSPEPSVYCDGGSGYVLSRDAMKETLEEVQSPEGQHLLLASFMEDKLLGDLLARRGISPSGADYSVTVQRRTHANAVPVSRWENSFHPGPLSPTKLAHLDSADLQLSVEQGIDKPRLWPRKLWPTFEKSRTGFGTNSLELVSDEDKLARLNEAPVAVVACMRNETFMLPHFLAHYRKLGVTSFLIADNCSDDGTLEYLLEQPDVAVFSVDTDYAQSHYGVAWQMAIVSNLRVGRWSLVADADELLVYEGSDRITLPELLEQPQWQDANAARIYMLDMYPEGTLEEADFSSGDPFQEAGFVDREPFLRNTSTRGPYGNSTTVTSGLRHRLIANSRPELFVAQKYALLRYAPWMRPSAGMHYVGDIDIGAQEMFFGHFKYNAEFIAKARKEVARGQHFNNAEEYQKYLALLSEGREIVYQDGVSVHWRDCSEVQRILTGWG